MTDCKNDGSFAITTSKSLFSRVGSFANCSQPCETNKSNNLPCIPSDGTDYAGQLRSLAIKSGNFHDNSL